MGVPYFDAYDVPARRPQTEIEQLELRARREELARKEDRRAERRRSRRARIARLLGR